LPVKHIQNNIAVFYVRGRSGFPSPQMFKIQRFLLFQVFKYQRKWISCDFKPSNVKESGFPVISKPQILKKVDFL
jgi:hypothetical protein